MQPKVVFDLFVLGGFGKNLTLLLFWVLVERLPLIYCKGDDGYTKQVVWGPLTLCLMGSAALIFCFAFFFFVFCFASCVEPGYSARAFLAQAGQVTVPLRPANLGGA